MTDHLALAALLRARLTAELTLLRAVKSAAAIEEIADLVPAAPAAILLWDGDALVQDAGGGRVQSIDQRWLVCLVVRSAREAAANTGVLEIAGPLIAQTLRCLQGWTPDLPGARPLKRIEAPKPGFAAGYGYFPLAFAARLIIQGD